MASLEIITLRKKSITDFARERNNLLENAKAKWVFFLDSDEKMSGELRKEILKQVQDGKYNGYYVQRKNYFLGRYVGTDNIIRLGKRNAGKWTRRVHEVWKIKDNIGELKSPIIHNTAKSLHEYLSKINYYSTLHAQANDSEGKRSNLFKMIFYPKVKFVQSILGGRGIVFSIYQAFHSFLAWGKQWELQEK